MIAPTLHHTEDVPLVHGRHLRMFAAARFSALPQFAEVAKALEAEGYVLRALTLPIWQLDGAVVVRLVWRRRADGSSVVVQEPLRGEVPPSLLDALMRGTQSGA